MKKQRIVVVDQLRGFALLGIFLVNMLAFHSPFLYIDPYSYWEGSDLVSYSIIQVFFQSSMYPLFALLFGFGVAMMVDRLKEKGIPFKLVMTRRMTFLLIVGFVHGWFIWSGDILFSYAILGFVLLFFVSASYRFLRTFAITLWGVTSGLLALLSLSLLFEEDYGDYLDISSVTKSIEAYKYGGFSEVTMQRITDWLFANGPDTLLIQLLLLFPIVLLGAAVKKSNLFLREDIRFGRWAIFFWVIGLAVKSIPVWAENKSATIILAIYIGGPLLTAAYVATFQWMQQFAITNTLFQPFQLVGKLSMSVYLSQSIIATLIFYGYGLGLYDSVSVATGSFLAISIYCIQVILSYFIVKRFSQGPMEYVWRKVTYLM